MRYYVWAWAAYIISNVCTHLFIYSVMYSNRTVNSTELLITRKLVYWRTEIRLGYTHSALH